MFTGDFNKNDDGENNSSCFDIYKVSSGDSSVHNNGETIIEEEPTEIYQLLKDVDNILNKFPINSSWTSFKLSFVEESNLPQCGAEKNINVNTENDNRKALTQTERANKNFKNMWCYHHAICSKKCNDIFKEEERFQINRTFWPFDFSGRRK